MERRKQASRLATFLVVFLLVTLPISTSAQLNAATTVAAAEEQPQQLLNGAEASYFLQGDVGPQVWCLWPAKDCAGKCSWCFLSTWYCGSTGSVCCENSAKFCDSSAGKCWADNCPAGTKWVCKSTGAVCESVCKDTSYPKYCGGQCWSGCPDDQYRTYKFVCDTPPWCQVVSCIHPTYPNKCNNNCWGNCGSGEALVCPSSGNPYCVLKCTDNDGDGYGTGCSKGSDCNDNNINVNPGKSETCNSVDDDCDGETDEGVKNACGSCGDVPSETCGDGKDNDCDSLIDEGCCSDPNPYNCAKTGTCWTKEKCDEAISCNGQWWACIDSTKYDPKCVNSQIGCCEPRHPYYCPANNWCFSSDSYCDGRTVHNCNSKYQVCNKKADVGQCFGDVLRCCPSGETWWESDKQCHKSSEPQKCSVPDGTSANCDCDSDSECAKADPSKPYCGETYGIRTSQGFHKCLSSKPEYCGNGKCGSGEDYKNCAADCGSLAPKGTINVNVYYSSGANANKPITGASVSLDGVQKGTTDGNGKSSFVASYGSRTVKVECPDNAFCAEKTVDVDGAESVSFGCNCNPSTDSDGDGYSNEDEVLLGTNPKDANSNFKTTFTSDSVDLLACIPTPATFLILWKEYKKSGSIIQSHSHVVNSLNVTSVMSTSFEEKPYVVAQALAAANLDTEGAEVIVNPVNVTLESVMKKTEYVDGVRMQDGILLIATDKDGQTTALIAIGAGCVGAFSGSVYGIGQGLFDDIKGVIDGIWFVITHLGEVNKIWSGAKELVAGIAALGKNLDETFWSMFRGILGKGKSINLFREGGLNQPEPYRHFQVGFFYGFVTGYLVEQVALGAIILSKVAKAFKLGQLFGKAGKAAKLMEKLAIIRGAEEFGAEIAEKLSKLKYIKEGVENWLDSEIKGLARIMKHNEDWLKGLSEAEAKIAAKHADELAAAGKVTDAAFGNLAKTKLGQHTLKAADSTTDLLAKQSKLVSKWGVKKADEIVSKCFLGICYGNRIDDLNKILKAMPEGVIDDFSPERAVKFLGEKGFADILLKGTTQNVIDLTKVDAEKFMQYIKAVRKIGVKDPLAEIGEHQLLKMYKTSSVTTKVGDQTVDGIAVLKKGYHDFVKDQGFGWDHIKAGKHDLQIQQALGLSDADKAVRDVIGEVIETGNVKHFSGDSYEITKKVVRGQKSHEITVIISDRQGSVGSIQTAHPI